MAWPIVKLCLAAYPQVWQRLAVPSDNPRAEAVGPDPDRILLLGPGKATGYGVSTHELGLGGHLARNLAALTSRGCGVDIVADPSMSAADAGVVIEWSRLERFDALVLTLGGGEVLRMRSIFAWRRDVTTVLDTIEERGGGVLQTFVLGIAPVDELLSLPGPLLRIVNANAVTLNEISEELCATRSSVTFVPVTTPSGGPRVALESHTYAHWARELAPAIASRLTHVAVPQKLNPQAYSAADSNPAAEATANDAAFDGSVLTANSVAVALEKVMDAARLMFGTTGAAVTFHDQQAHWFTSTSGVGDLRREEAGAFCSTAFTTEGLVVLEDTLLDERFADHPWVVRGPLIRFYAGYPISTPSGEIIGAVCIFDTTPRIFDSSHETLLRELAQRAQAAMRLQ
ncbi:Putative diguanylate cyclase (GGDEF domain) with GAF sensor domain [marine actinobacterium PHSC20C1]|nr:Putative diguanylate cyclase (GGDEF domain) with GAF sensor domain [marine actinobacterium PHSC20C1]